MNRLFATDNDDTDAVLLLGEMLRGGNPADEIYKRCEALLTGESPGAEEPFALFCRALSLDIPEAACLALWLYCDRSPVEPVSPAEMISCCRRIGGRSPAPEFLKLFGLGGDALVLHPVAADFLAARPPRLPDGLEFILPAGDAFFYIRDLFDELLDLLRSYIQLENPQPLMLCLRGENGSGRKFLFSKLAEALGFQALLADFSRGPHMGDIMLAAALYGAVVCVENFQESDRRVLEGLLDRTGLVFAVCAEYGAIPEAEAAVLTREVPVPSAYERGPLLRLLLDGVQLSEEIDLDRMASPHRLNAGQALRFAGMLRAESGFGTKPVRAQAFFERLQGLREGALSAAVRLESPATLDSIVLPNDQMRQLRELRAFATLRETVYQNWGFGEKVAWGRGISALFYGAPGTGKTLAAAALANEIGLSLMRVDLSQLMSKYIGETQKNIGKVFDEAAKCDCVLFFDEADALFARRTEQGDAQDKYANAETAYLLQRMEQHDGICILATNLLQNFDEAFRRRINYMLHFPMPDAALRERIWRGIFPAVAPTEELDFGFLATQLELSGASIKNSAVHAAYLAAMNQTEIKMEYILSGAKIEYAKVGKTLGPLAAQRLLY